MWQTKTMKVKTRFTKALEINLKFSFENFESCTDPTHQSRGRGGRNISSWNKTFYVKSEQ